MGSEGKTSDDILKELFSSINDIVGSSNESSSDGETKIVVKKEKKAKRTSDKSYSGSKHKRKKKKKSKKSTKYSLHVSSSSKKRKKSGREKKSVESSRSDESGSKRDAKKTDVELPLIEVLKKEVIESVPSVISLSETSHRLPFVSEELPVVVKLEKLKTPEKDLTPSKKGDDLSPRRLIEPQENERATFSTIADVFVEDMIENEEESVTKIFKAPSDKQKKVIVIQNLEHCSVLKEAAKVKAALEESKRKRKTNQEEGELSESSKDSSVSSDEDLEDDGAKLPQQRSPRSSEKPKKKSSRHSRKKKKKKSKHSHKESKEERTKSKGKIAERSSTRSSTGSEKRSTSSSHRGRSRSREGTKLQSLPQHSCTHRHRRSGSRSLSTERSRKNSRSRSRSRRKDRSKEKHAEKKLERINSRKKSPSRSSRSRSHSGHRHYGSASHSRSQKDEYFIDKGKLLEIARRNALSMMKQRQVGSDMNKVVHITAGGKTVDQLTDFCKHLSQKDADGMESISSCGSSDEDDKAFHHPFKLKERPNQIIMNIRNCVPIPVKTHQEKATENLRLQFPVSSGQHHRKTESEWVPVSPKRAESAAQTTAKKKDPVIQNAIEAAPLTKPPSVHYSSVYPPPVRMDIGDVISERLAAIQKEQEAPRAQSTGSWVPGNPSGLFSGCTGARVLTPYELASGQQAWARKDQFISATPVSGGMGMSLLQKMGWKPGEGLGKNHEGTLEPLKLPVKMDKKGLVCAEEMSWNQRQNANRASAKQQLPDIKCVEGKHPVSLLVEFCTRRWYSAPAFTQVLEEGPPHQKKFTFKVKVNDVEYQPSTSSSTKKIAKSEAAKECLRALGVLPSAPS